MPVAYSTATPIWRCGPLAPGAAQLALRVMRERVPRPFRPTVAAAVFGDSIELYFLDHAAHATMIFVAGRIGATELPSADDLPNAPVWIGPGLVDRFLAGRCQDAAPLQCVRPAVRFVWWLVCVGREVRAMQRAA